MEGITLHGVSVLQSWRRELMLQRLKAFLREARIHRSRKRQTAASVINLVI